MERYINQFNALGHKGRLQIFRLLVRAGPRGLCVEEIRRRVPMPGSTLSHHLDTLTRSRLLAARRSGRFIYHVVDWNKAARLIRFLTEDCCADLNYRATAPAEFCNGASPRTIRRAGTINPSAKERRPSHG